LSGEDTAASCEVEKEKEEEEEEEKEKEVVAGVGEAVRIFMEVRP
jgi:kinesin family protein C2/C3